MAQALFANQREANLQSTIALIEEVLVELGHPPARVTVDGTLHAWRVAHGSASVVVSLVERPQFTHLRISAVVMTLDNQVARAELFAHLLTLNASLCGNAFALEGDRVLLLAERSTLDLDRSEILDLVRRVTRNADDHDDALVAKFGGSLGG
jgi:hypothetical protein